MKNYKFYENKIISNKDRFKLSASDEKELKHDFNNAKILILGAAGSIGSVFTKRLIKLNFKNLYLIDKNENDLTELNREIVLLSEVKKLNKISYFCSDLTSLNLDVFLKEKKISHYLNFAAIKHVRSEEELISLKYMFLTNTQKILPTKKFYLKKVFCISTDKTVDPTSLLGLSKKLMEKKLSKFKKNNKNTFVSSVRFANVSFSNGSILKYVVDRVHEKKIFGVPKNIKRYFITHDEATSLCFKSLLKKNDRMILASNENFLRKEYSIQSLTVKILKLNKYNPIFFNKIKNKNIKIEKNYPVLLTMPNNHGQKYYEKFYENSEKVFTNKMDRTISMVNLPVANNIDKVIDDLLKIKNIKKIKFFLMKNFKSYKPPSNVIKVSQSL
jgi:FlaA1/EpsC-like NDP-sugar epimerase